MIFIRTLAMLIWKVISWE